MTSRDYWIESWKDYFIKMDSPSCFVDYEKKIKLYEADRIFPGVMAEGHKKYLQHLKKKRA